MFFLTNCEKDSTELTESTLENVESAPSFFEAQPEVYRAAGDAYREDMFLLKRDLDSGTLELTDNVDDIYLGSQESIMGELTGHVQQGVIGEEDLSKLIEFNEAIPALGLTANMALTEARSVVESWMQNNGVTVIETPMTYHAISVATEALLKTQVTRLEEDSKQPTVLKGANDNTLCTVSGWFCGQSNATVSRAAQAALALGVRDAFRRASDWSSAQQSAAIAAILFIVNTFWDDIFCNEDCDDCGPAAGIRAVYNGCNFTGLQAIGSFEYAEAFEYLIDINQDGVYDITRELFNDSGFIPKSSLPTTPFKVIVDVLCDGGRGNVPGSRMSWPVDR